MKISLIMPIKDAYRTRDYIEDALSISPLFDEILIYSDTPINNKYIPEFKNRFILDNWGHLSVADSLNLCIKESTGDWILPLCDDDYCKSVDLENIIHQIRTGYAEDYDIICAPFYYGNEKTEWKLQPKQPEPINFESIAKCSYLPFTAFYKKSAWEAVHGYQNMPFNDWVYWLSMAKKNMKFLQLDTPYFYWRTGHLKEPSLFDKEVHLNNLDTRKQIFDYLETI